MENADPAAAYHAAGLALRCADHKQRGGKVHEQSLGRAAQQQPIDAAAAPRRDNDEVRSLFRGFGRDPCAG